MIHDVVKKIASALNNEGCPDYVSIENYNRLAVYEEFYRLEIVVRLPKTPTS